MRNAVVEVTNLRFKYAGSREYVLRGLSLSVSDGEVVVVTAPTGSGKTTLCRVLTGLIPKLYGGELSGRVKVVGMSPVHAVRVGKVMYVGSNPEEQFLFPTVDEEVRSYGISDDAVEEVLALLGLENLRASTVFKLSMGEKQRVTLAAALAKAPKLLILDEALAFIDEPYLTRVIGYVVELSRRGSSVLLVTKAPHIIARLAGLGAKLALIDEGVVKVSGDARTILMTGRGDAHPFLKGLRSLIVSRHDAVREVVACRAS